MLEAFNQAVTSFPLCQPKPLLTRLLCMTDWICMANQARKILCYRQHKKKRRGFFHNFSPTLQMRSPLENYQQMESRFRAIIYTVKIDTLAFLRVIICKKSRFFSLHATLHNMRKFRKKVKNHGGENQKS